MLNQLGSNLQNVQLCVTSGFHGNEELSFAYITSKAVLLYYKSWYYKIMQLLTLLFSYDSSS